MPNTDLTYTKSYSYKHPRIKLDDPFIARAPLDRFTLSGVADKAGGMQTTFTSIHVVAPPAELEFLMERSRKIAPTHQRTMPMRLKPTAKTSSSPTE